MGETKFAVICSRNTIVFLLCPLFLFSAIFFLSIIQYRSVPIPLSPPAVKLDAAAVHPKADEGGGNGTCDYSSGEWVRDFHPPAFLTNCAPEPLQCLPFGKDPSFLYWRWKPLGCNLPALDTREFITVVRGKTMFFIGDSLARSQMISLLCILSRVQLPVTTTNSDDRYQTWKFLSFNFTIKYIRTEFLALGKKTRDMQGDKWKDIVFDVYLDKVDTSWSEKLPEADFVIFSTGNWFFNARYLHKEGKVVGCINCTKGKMKNLVVSDAMRDVMRTTMEFIIHGCRNCRPGLVTMVRTYSPPHYEGGEWFEGGYCKRAEPLQVNATEFAGGSLALELQRVQVEEVERATSMGTRRRRIELLDVTKAMRLRADAHPDSHWVPKRGRFHDCLHWCLPGPVEMWNDLLLVKLKAILAEK